MRAKGCLPFVLVLISLISIKTLAQNTDTPRYKIADVQYLSELIGSQYTFNKALLAPNGETIAWVEPQVGLCTYALAAQTTACTPWPWPDDYMSAFTRYDSMYFEWSPDSQYLALAQDSFRLFYDSDIWIYKIADASFINLTEDNFSGVMLVDSPTVHLIPIDYSPVWGPNSDEIYFFRTNVPPPSDSRREFFEGLSLYKVSLDTGLSILISDFSDQLSFYAAAASMSDDGRYLAFWGYIEHPTPSWQGQGGIYVFDTADNTLKQIVDIDSFKTGMPEWVTQWRITSNSSLQWVANGQGLLISGMGSNENLEGDLLNYYYVDPVANTITPLLDLTLTTVPPLNDSAENPESPLAFTGFISNDEKTFFCVCTLPNPPTILLGQQNLPPEPNQMRITLGVISHYNYSYYGLLFRVSQTNQVLLDGQTLLTLTRSPTN